MRPLPDQCRALVAGLIAAHYRGLAWCWLAIKTTSSPEWQAASVVVRPIYSDLPEIHLVGGRVAIGAEHVTATEAARKWTDAIAGRGDINNEPVAHSLLGGRLDAFWGASGETWEQ